ncbi:unnamed protein product [Ilex paraguariensis]|uniref:DUF4283 domain-containing protein n=1 Tax=Ilex paraguariensis TaxID=185542 RepID=A0ABC8TCD2_9AQUA
MDEEMQQLWRNFTLVDEESLGVHLLDQGDGDFGEKDKLCFFGKVLSINLYNKMAFKTTIKKVWNIMKVKFIEARDNLLFIQFSNMLDKNRVLEEYNNAKAGEDKLSVVKNNGVSLKSRPESLEQSHKVGKVVNELSNMGVNGLISRVEEIPITESISGRQNMERGMIGELIEPLINKPILY